jgi:hypothetical protein
MIASDVTVPARDLHPKFEDLQHPDSVLIATLGRIEQSLFRRAVAAGSTLFAAADSVALPLAVHSAGTDISAYHVVHGVTAVDSVNADITEKVELIPPDYRDDPKLFPSGWMEGGTLYLSGAATDWNGYQSIIIHATSLPTAPTSLASTLTLPDNAKEALIYSLGEMMALRESDGGLLQILQQRALIATQQWLDDIVNQATALTFTVREVF